MIAERGVRESCAREIRIGKSRGSKPVTMVNRWRYSLVRLLHLHLPPRHPRAMDRHHRRVGLLDRRKGDEAKPLAPPILLVERHLGARHRAILAKLSRQVSIVKLVILAAAHLAHNKEVGARRPLDARQVRVARDRRVRRARVEVGRPRVCRLAGRRVPIVGLSKNKREAV